MIDIEKWSGIKKSKYNSNREKQIGTVEANWQLNRRFGNTCKGHHSGTAE